MSPLGAVTVLLDRCARRLTASLCGLRSHGELAGLGAVLGRRARAAPFRVRSRLPSGKRLRKRAQGFRKAYALSKRPAILLNIATVHERRGTPKRRSTRSNAISRWPPKARRRRASRIGSPTWKSASKPRPRPRRHRRRHRLLLRRRPPRPPLRRPAPSTPPPSPAAERKPPNRIPAYIALSIGGLSAAGAMLTGILAQSEYSNAEASANRTAAMTSFRPAAPWPSTSTILTGVAVVGVGIGAALFFTGASEPEPVPAAGVPRVFVGIGPRGGGAQASWSF